jgi:hypothetical protein
MKTKLRLSILALLGVMASAANATDIFINRGVNLDADADTVTDSFSQLGFGQWKATSIYQDLDNSGDLSALDSIYDTNIQANLVSIFGAGTTIWPALSGGGATVSLNSTIDTGNAQFTGLLPLTPFLNSVEGFNATWNLTTQYEIFGNFGDLLAGKPFSSGYFDIYLNTDNLPGNVTATDKFLLRLDVTGSLLTLANLNIFGTVSAVGAGNIPDPAGGDTGVPIADFFNFANPASTFGSLIGQNLDINWILDTNTDPPIPTDNQLAVVPDNGNGDYFIRQAQLDGSIEFNKVPEPTTTALLAIGLLGFGAVARKKGKTV